MKKTEKKSLFTAINEEESATISGGNITISGDISAFSNFIGFASQYVDLQSFKELLAASKTNS